MATKARIIQIGNSKGIRIPKALLEHCDLGDEVEIEAEPGRLIVSACRQERTGWSEAARAMRVADDDRLLDAPTSTTFDRDDWQW